MNPLWQTLRLLPKNWISRLWGHLTEARLPLSGHHRLKHWFAGRFSLDLAEAEKSIDEYPVLADLFTRRLRPGARPVAGSDFIFPCDGMLTGGAAFGSEPGLEQVKGRHYSLQAFIGGGWPAAKFAGGGYLVIYLAPRDYHRVHCPADARLGKTVHIPGALWPVNDWSVRNIDGLFLANERIITELATPHGHLLLAMVGATNVGKMTLSFCPFLVGNSAGIRELRDWHPSGELNLAKGDEFGCFCLGSTVVLVGDRLAAARWRGNYGVPKAVRMGMELA